MKVVSERKARSTGTTVQVLDNRDFTEDAVSPWLNICVEHGGLVGHDTRALAVAFAPYPVEWCPVCQEEESA